ncbi:DUF2264 domain-containing protein [Streptomyces cavernicola]|uniref:DUF2264 domain-containing protein n=1 Tax=Streptomyces cavernicola TaxID=3043613 RepID=A0ABT6S949_9ACTN|nr:DUF2264 domain-containing protein [Streptomyces sp. B-S-A6]MDI3403811.1 DUF2264 domain-containing protein [Streptomyces sp. B-S-A6]
MSPRKEVEASSGSRVSPYTGWERHHWGALADRMLSALDAHRSPGGARILLPGPHSVSGPDSDGLEGYARSLLLAGFRIAGEGGADPGNLLERYAAGLAAGTDPHHPEAWPRPDLVPQAKVEAASLALILQLTREWLWDKLDDRVREATVAWLATVIDQPYVRNNWVWFRIVTESFLREAGGPWSATDIEEDLAFHATMRREDGWLADGAERNFDHYVGWALHTYPLLWTHLFDVTGSLCPPEVRARWEADLARYLDDAVRLVGADGSPLLQGRSLIYRYAAAAPLWTGALTGATRLAPGLTRRAASGMLDHFALRQVPGADGLLTLGWHHAWPAMRQSYSGPGSPYWAAKGMLGLALPADHPVWTAVEEPLPVEVSDQSRTVAAPGWLVSARRADGLVTVLNHGTDHALPGTVRADAPLYARLGYSTATLPPLTGPTVADPVDNTVALLDTDGHASHRTGFTALGTRELPCGALLALSSGRVHWVDSADDDGLDHGSGRTGPAVEGPVVTVASVVRAGVEVRLCRVDGPPGPAVQLRLGGWPLSSDTDPRAAYGNTPEAYATVSTDRLTSRLYSLAGFGAAGVHLEEGTGPLGRATAIPWLTADVPAPGTVLAAAVTLSGEAPVRRPSLEVQQAGSGGQLVRIVWPDGAVTEAQLPKG